MRDLGNNYCSKNVVYFTKILGSRSLYLSCREPVTANPTTRDALPFCELEDEVEDWELSYPSSHISRSSTTKRPIVKINSAKRTGPRVSSACAGAWPPNPCYPWASKAMEVGVPPHKRVSYGLVKGRLGDVNGTAVNPLAELPVVQPKGEAAGWMWAQTREE